MKKLTIKLKQKKFIKNFNDFLDNFEELKSDDVEIVLSVCNACEMKFRDKGSGEIKKETVCEILKSRMNIEFLHKTIDWLCASGLVMEKTILRRLEYLLKKNFLKNPVLIY